MTAAVIAVGSELLRAGREDTNGRWLAGRLADLGVETLWRASVEDDPARIAGLIGAACAEASIVLVTGGLGPTEDDRTREALSRALGAPLERDPVMEAEIVERFRRRGRRAGPAQSRQADRPRGAAWIENPIGSAPGILADRGEGFVAALPGVPAEMKAMFEATVVPLVAERAGGGTIARKVLRIAGKPESAVEEAVSDLYATPGTETTILSSPGIVELVLTARGSSGERAREELAALEGAMRARLGRDLFGVDRDSLAAVAGALLAARGETVAVGESCTGGLLGAALTDVPGSSAWFHGGLVCYTDASKRELAGVSEELLRAKGAVSEAVASALAAAARRAFGTTYGLGVTGIAGPAGGTPDKPVGTVYIALDDGAEGAATRLDWPGDRDLVRRRAVAVALDMLRRRLLPR